MSVITRRALRLASQAVTRVNRKLQHMLDGGGPSQRKPFVASLEEAYASGWANCPCAFVVSTGRVGTKTLTGLLSLSPDVVATHEPEPRLVKASFDAYMEGGDIGRSERWRAVVLGARDDAVYNANRRGRIYVETNPRLTYLAPALATCFPASRFVHLHRHPYEVVRSWMRRGHYQGHSWDFVRLRPRPDEPLAGDWKSLPVLEKNAWHWARITSEALAFLDSLPASRTLDLRAEALFAGDPAAIGRLFDFVGTAVPRRDWITEVLGRKINAQRRGVYAAPKDWTESERAAVWARVGAVAERLGYER
jgi:hypothetical protein